MVPDNCNMVRNRWEGGRGHTVEDMVTVEYVVGLPLAQIRFAAVGVSGVS